MTPLEWFGLFILGTTVAWGSLELQKAIRRRDKERFDERTRAQQHRKKRRTLNAEKERT